jgi:hypothetical protein
MRTHSHPQQWLLSHMGLYYLVVQIQVRWSVPHRTIKKKHRCGCI